MLVRDCECLECSHRWTQAIKQSAATPNISGEETRYCPRCYSRSTAASPAYEGVERFGNIRVRLCKAGHDEGRCQACGNFGEEWLSRSLVYVIEMETRNIMWQTRVCENCRRELVEALTAPAPGRLLRRDRALPRVLKGGSGC